MGKAIKYAKAILRSLWRIERYMQITSPVGDAARQVGLQTLAGERQRDEEELGGDD